MLCTLQSVKQLIGIQDTDVVRDVQFTALIVAASAMMESYCGVTFGQTQNIVDELADGDGTEVLFLTSTPCIALTALAIRDMLGANWQPIPVDTVAIYPKYLKFPKSGDYNARLRGAVRIFPAGSQTVKISYTSGYATVPADIATAATIQVAFLKNTVQYKGLTTESNTVSNTNTGYSQSPLAPETRLICNKYRRRGIAVI